MKEVNDKKKNRKNPLILKFLTTERILTIFNGHSNFDDNSHSISNIILLYHVIYVMYIIWDIPIGDKE